MMELLKTLGIGVAMVAMVLIGALALTFPLALLGLAIPREGEGYGGSYWSDFHDGLTHIYWVPVIIVTLYGIGWLTRKSVER